MRQVDIAARSISPFVELVGKERVQEVACLAADIQKRLGPARVWNINSTASGGGVAEMLRSLLRYARGLGVDVGWLVLEGPNEFFRLTKRLHNALHEDPGDHGPLGPEQRAVYERTMKDTWNDLSKIVQPGDVVICHDPQTAGLVPELVRFGARVVWRCHIGHDRGGPQTERAWEFLRPYIEQAPVAVFTRETYAPPWIPRTRFVVLPPNIDPFCVKNQWMPETNIRTILAETGLVSSEEETGTPVLARDDGTVVRVSRKAIVVRESSAPPRWETPLVAQVSRWDRMKDPLGLLESFRHVAHPDAHLVIAGPMVYGVSDDPEAPGVLEQVHVAWRALSPEVRRRVHLAQLPVADTAENAAMVNALQRHATIIVQKSIREGFGLTVTEGMWNERPVVASAIGGIPDQVRDGIDGVLLRDPTNRREVARAIDRLLDDPALAQRLGRSGHERVRDRFLSISALEHWAAILMAL